MIRRRNNSPDLWLLFGVGRLGRPLDFSCVSACHHRVAQLLRQRLSLFQHFDCASYIAFT